MKTLFFSFIILGIQLLSSTTAIENIVAETSQDDEIIYSSPPVFCHFAGRRDINGWSSEYSFNIKDVLLGIKRCGIVVYGTYYFDMGPTIKTFILDKDKKAIKQLVAANKLVYITIGYYKDESQWSELMDVQDPKAFDTLITTLIDFCNDYRVHDVIMQSNYIYRQNTSSTDKNVHNFVKILKFLKQDLKVGILIGGFDYKQFTNEEAFSYNLINTIIDHYFIDLTISNPCNDRTKKSSVNPLTGAKGFLSMEAQTDAVASSKMPQPLIIAMLQVGILELITEYKPKDDEDVIFGSYAQLCSYKKNDEKMLWCSDYMSTLYNQGQYANSYYSGIMLSVIERDDFNHSCKCPQSFPISNAIISGWYNADQERCNNIDKLMSISSD